MGFNIYKDLSRHNHRTLYGQPVEQSWASMFVLEKMLANYRPDVVSELGTGDGTLTMYFQTYCRLNGGALFTRDIKPERQSAYTLEQLKASFTACDFHRPEVIKQVVAELAVFERPFLFVDGADPKADEVNMYSPLLRQGTLVFAHDYHTDPVGDRFRWGYGDDRINWTLVEKAEPYCSMARQLNTRTLCLRVK